MISEFRSFCEGHGAIIPQLIDDGRIHSCKTTNKPKKRNGRYKADPVSNQYWYQDWAVMDRPVFFKSDQPVAPRDLGQQRARAQAAAREERDKQIASAKVAQQVVAGCTMRIPRPSGPKRANSFAYLCAKGFEQHPCLVDEDARMLTWAAKQTGMKRQLSGDLLVIPVRNRRRYDFIQSIQWIDKDGTKLFLRGGRMRDGVHILGNAKSPTAWFCEGFATGLAIHSALRTASMHGSVWVCFSAGELQNAAKAANVANKFVFADHDESGAGERAARFAGVPWCMSEDLGDANDLLQNSGIYSVISTMRGAITGE